MRVRALAVRIINQMRHDRRTLALIILAPMLVLTLLYFILDETENVHQVAVLNAPAAYVEKLDDYNIVPLYCSEAEAQKALEESQVIAVVNIVAGKAYIQVDYSNSTKGKQVLTALENANRQAFAGRADLTPEVTYMYGYEDLKMFDNFGSLVIGFLIFFFVFLISGISFLQERTTGTLEKLLSTPIRRWEIVAGYVLGFGSITVLQSLVISLYCIYVLKTMMVGSFLLVLLVTVSSAVIALTLGTLVSSAASNEFQMIQFIPIIVVPQVFFAGLFDLSPTLASIGKVMPLYYIADALTEVMIKGHGFTAIAGDLSIIWGLSLVFMIINTMLLKKYRRI